MTGTARAETIIENDRTVVTRWDFETKGDNTGWHRHEMDYVIIPLSDGWVDIENPDGSISKSEMKKGVPYFRQKGVEHDVVNANDHFFSFIEVEIKT